MTEAQQMAEKAVGLLKKYGKTVAPAESCTGGTVCGFLTAVPGASEVLELGITTYSCRIKTECLGVSSETLKKYGAVSSQTAGEMALGVQKLGAADYGISVTGVAGPGRSEGKPVGLVYIGVAGITAVTVEELHLKGDREKIRTDAAAAVLRLLCNTIERENNR